MENEDKLQALHTRTPKVIQGAVKKRCQQHRRRQIDRRERLEILLDEGSFQSLDVRQSCQYFAWQELTRRR